MLNPLPLPVRQRFSRKQTLGFSGAARLGYGDYRISPLKAKDKPIRLKNLILTAMDLAKREMEHA